MLKITKGFHKKKKGKKGKHKEEELFEEAELEQYRKEQEKKRQQQLEEDGGGEASEGAGAGASSESKEKGEEWERFKALTSGVDSILKKTQDDLDRIKQQSYYQRKPTAVQLEAQEKEDAQKKDPDKKPQPQVKDKKKEKKWVGFEDGTVDLGDGDQTPEEEAVDEKEQEVDVAQELQEAQEEHKSEEEEEEEEDEYEDIFDTSYVDVVASGEVKLAYIPESPTEEEGGFDPFDTSIVDQVIKETPEDKKKRKLVSLGCAVDILTGKVERPTTTVEAKQKRSSRRPRQQDLLLGSFDFGDQEVSQEPVTVEVDEPQKTLLDDDPVLGEDIEVDLSINLAPIATAAPTPSPLKELSDPLENFAPEIKSIVSEFDIITSDELVNEVLEVNKKEEDPEDDLEDEFALLAAESLTKEVKPVTLPDTGETAEVQESEKSKPKPGRPPPPVSSQVLDAVPSLPVQDLDEFNIDEGDDPFDTSFAAEVVPGKYELRLIEEEILREPEKPANNTPAVVSIQLPKSNSSLRDPLAFDEHNFLEDDQTPLSFKHRDLLGGSTTDLSKISHSPIEPSTVNKSVNDSIGNGSINTEELSYCDPFDTSVVNDLVAPGKAELKFLEKELLAEGPSTTATVVPTVESDEEFDPRAHESPPRKKSIPRPENLFLGDNNKRQSIPKVVAFKVASPEPIQDLLSVGQNENSKVSKPLTPYYPEPKVLENKSSCENESDTSFVDPFDTSFVSSVPGKLELKLIENELVGEVVAQSAPPPPAPVQPSVVLPTAPAQPRLSLKHSVSDPDFDPRAPDHTENNIAQNQDFLSEGVDTETKLHTPVVPKRIEDELDVSGYSDPFDTSIAQHILPGKAELKLLESELILSSDRPEQ